MTSPDLHRERRLRVAYFTESIPPLTDGVSRTYDRLFHHLDSRRVRFRVYAPVTPPAAASWARRVRRSPSFQIPFYDMYRVSFPASEWEKELDAFRPDLLHAAAPTPAGFFALRYANQRGVPCVTAYHTHFASYFKYYGVGPLEGLGWGFLRRFHNAGAATFVPSTGVMRDLDRKGFRRLRYWGRGVETSRFSPERRDEKLRAAWGARDGEPLVLFVGRMVREKDLDVLAASTASLRAKGRRFGLVMVGEGPYRKSLQRRMPWAVWLGRLEGEALSAAYASCDLFAFPSTTETLGNVIQEAFASGLPAVVARCGGPAGLVRDGWNGFTARPWDRDDFAVALDRLLEDPALRASCARGALDSVQNRTWEQVHDALLGHYRSLLETRPPWGPQPLKRGLALRPSRGALAVDPNA